LSILSATSTTYADIKNSLNPDGSAALIIPILELSCPVVKSATVKEGNMSNGNQTVHQATKGTATKRSYNVGVAKSKVTQMPVVDMCSMYEANVEVDCELLEKQPNPQGYMAGQEKAAVAAMTEDFETDFFYGNQKTNILSIDGLASRYKALSTTKTESGYQIVNAGGSTNLSSLYLVGWGANAFNLFYPMGSQAGIKRRFNLEQRVTDAAANPFYASTVNVNWQVGLMVENYRMGGRIANIDTVALQTYGSSSDTSPELFKFVTTLKNRLQYKNGFKFCWYADEVVIGVLEAMVRDKYNVMLTMKEQMDAMPELYLNGWPVLLSDKILNSETAVS